MALKKTKKVAQKRATTGFEVEFFIIDKNTGEIVNGADDIIKKVQETSQKDTHNIVTESSRNLVEVGSYPDVDGANTMTNLIEGLKLLVYVADELGLAVLPLGHYPGKFTPSMREAPHYKSQQKLYGKTRFQISGRCAGYHCHTSLPWGVFDSKTQMLKDLTNLKNQQSLIHSYNALVALDPALTTFMQSSPFYQGKYIAKDSRMIVYRGGAEFGMKDVKGLYTNFPRFGALPPYEHSGTDLIRSIEERHRDRIQAMQDAGIAEKDIPKYKSILTTNWSPVKINPHGTLEQRGMDMNHLPLVLSVSVLIWRVLHHIQAGYTVAIHDSGKQEPFRIEKGTIYIAPDTHVRTHLQKLSAIEGLANDEIYNYCKRLVALVKQLDGKKVEWLLQPLDKMLEERKTTSDKIIAQAQELGHKDLKKALPQEIAAKIAISHSKQMFEDIVLLQKMIEEHQKLTA